VPSPKVVTERAELRSVLNAMRPNKKVGFVPTMGALHEGHAQLLKTSKQRNDVSVLSVFVNPKQFGPNEDFSRYPRTFEGDLVLAAEAGVDVVFAPTVAQMYPEGFLTQVAVGQMGEVLCGAHRPGHFDGVCTVVLLLLNLVQAHEAYFGLKDFQQFAILSRMAKDLAHPTTLVGLPTVREQGGLALSSRNRYLSEAEKQVAQAVPHALAAAIELWLEGERSAQALEKKAKETLVQNGLESQYLEVRTSATLAKVSDKVTEESVLALAQWVGKTRLIDNVILGETSTHIEDLRAFLRTVKGDLA
jgi:pantoate--beta-alanine ligase